MRVPYAKGSVVRWFLGVSRAGHAKSGLKLGGPPPKAKYRQRPIVDQYREGMVKSTPARGVKEILKPCASGWSEQE